MDGGGQAIEEHSFNTERFAAATCLNFPFEWVAEEPLEWCLPPRGGYISLSALRIRKIPLQSCRTLLYNRN